MSIAAHNIDSLTASTAIHTPRGSPPVTIKPQSGSNRSVVVRVSPNVTALAMLKQISSCAPDASPFRASIRQLIQTAVVFMDGDPERARNALLRVSDLLESPQHPVFPLTPGPARQVVRGALAAWQIKKLLQYIEGRLAQPIVGQELANVIGVSRGQLFRGFKASVGIRPLQYVALMRIRHAQKLMSTTRAPLAQIALACGLCDQAHFCRRFRRMVGQTPGEWRREHAVAPESLPIRSRSSGR